VARNKSKWSDLSESQKRAIYVGGAIESVLTTYAIRDLVKRPSSGVRGPKVAWVLAFFVQPFGPIAYFAAGRR
jgi:hypothetical protein